MERSHSPTTYLLDAYAPAPSDELPQERTNRFMEHSHPTTDLGGTTSSSHSRPDTRRPRSKGTTSGSASKGVHSTSRPRRGNSNNADLIQSVDSRSGNYHYENGIRKGSISRRPRSKTLPSTNTLPLGGSEVQESQPAHGGHPNSHPEWGPADWSDPARQGYGDFSAHPMYLQRSFSDQGLGSGLESATTGIDGLSLTPHTHIRTQSPHDGSASNPFFSNLDGVFDREVQFGMGYQPESERAPNLSTGNTSLSYLSDRNNYHVPEPVQDSQQPAFGPPTQQQAKSNMRCEIIFTYFDPSVQGGNTIRTVFANMNGKRAEEMEEAIGSWVRRRQEWRRNWLESQ